MCSHSPGPGHEQRRAVFDPPLNDAGAFLLAVDDHGLLGGDLKHLLAGDLLVDPGIEPDLRRSGQMLLPPVAVADDQVISRVCDMMDHALKLASAAPDSPWADDHLHRAVGIPHQDALAFLNDVKPHA